MIVEILILLTTTIFFTLVFIIALLVLFYVLTNFILGQVERLKRNNNILAVISSLSKVFIVSFLSLSFFIYSISFLLRVENNVFKQEKSIRTSEIAISPEREPLLLNEENSELPLFDIVIQTAAQQNDKKRLTFILASGVFFAFVAIAAMGGYFAYLSKK